MRAFKERRLKCVSISFEMRLPKDAIAVILAKLPEDAALVGFGTDYSMAIGMMAFHSEEWDIVDISQEVPLLQITVSKEEVDAYKSKNNSTAPTDPMTAITPNTVSKFDVYGNRIK